MRFSRVLKSSPHCLASPDGKLVATLLPSSISIRAVESLDVTRPIRLPADLGGGVTTFLWSPSSERLLLATADEIHVFSATEDDFHATIRNPSSSVARSSFVGFGATDREVCVCTAHGIKLSLFYLSSPSKAVEITSPKFYTTSSAARGFSFRPHTHHLALLTRTAGKDTISIHDPASRETQRSWSSDIVDAQGLAWTPDGRWLVVWESAAQGHRVQFFTPDGHKYRDWCGPLHHASEASDYRLSAGVKLLAFSPNSQYVAIGDFGRCLYVLHTANGAKQLQLRHPFTLEPKEILQIWQEQINISKEEVSTHAFVKASQPVSPPSLAASKAQELKSGPCTVLFDCSAALLAVILEDAPAALWIWDISKCELRAVLMLHAEISRVDWHPTQPGLLSVRCEGDSYNGIIFVWDSLGGVPRSIDFRSLLPEGKIHGRVSVYWLDSATESASLVFTDNKSCVFGSLADADEEVLPQQERYQPASSDWIQAAESQLDLVSVSAADSDDHESDMGGDLSELDDTFHFKKFGVE
ncbi:WD40 repeat-like protein [Xylariales sp. AK1849]|nr:WD40 repeat-like protein [Xylariales sp. AK1849]